MIEFQNPAITKAPIISKASASDKNIVLMPCSPLSETKAEIARDLATLLNRDSAHHRRVKTEFAALNSDFGHSQLRQFESAPKELVESNSDADMKPRLRKIRLRSKPAPPVMMDTVISEEVERLPMFGSLAIQQEDRKQTAQITFNTDANLKREEKMLFASTVSGKAARKYSQKQLE